MMLEVKITYNFGGEEGAMIWERAGVESIFQSVGNVLFFDLGCDYKEAFILWIICSAVHLIFCTFIMNVILFKNFNNWTSLVAQMVKHLPTIWESRVWSLGQEDPLEKEMATHSSVLAWKISWTEEPGRLQSMGSQRVGHDLATSLSFTLIVLL